VVDAAGIPLSRVAGMLRPLDEAPVVTARADRDSILVDLNATMVALDEQLDELQTQRQQVELLIASVEQHDHLSPMPPVVVVVVVRFYQEIEHRTSDERVRRAIRQERNFMELAYYRGEIPDGELTRQPLRHPARQDYRRGAHHDETININIDGSVQNTQVSGPHPARRRLFRKPLLRSPLASRLIRLLPSSHKDLLGPSPVREQVGARCTSLTTTP
jgi:hypothetical protein